MSSPQILTEPINLVHKIVQPSELGTGRAPTLVLLHGRGTDEHDLLALADRFDSRFLLVSLRAPYPFPFGGYTWYSTTPTGAPDTNTLQRSLARLGKFVDILPRLYASDTVQIYLMGFSMGGAMALALGLMRPGRLAGIVAHSGFIPEGVEFPAGGTPNSTPCYQAHGAKDQVVPATTGQRAREQMRAAGFAVEYHEYPIAHEISHESLAGATQWLSTHLDGAAPA